MDGSPTDWTTGERVFAPPSGTLDPDWLVPAVLELVPGVTAEEAREVLHRVWCAEHAGTAFIASSDLEWVALRVVVEAVEAFGA